MSQVCRIDIGRGQALYPELEEKLRILANRIRERYPVTRIIVVGSYVRGELHEGSDIDLVVVGDIPGRFHERGMFIRDLTDLPVETLWYTPMSSMRWSARKISSSRRSLQRAVTCKKAILN